jgi:ribonuclease HII
MAAIVGKPETAAASAPAAQPRRAAGRRRTGRKLFRFDRSLGCRFVAGADEAGRGSLAGPLVAAAVLFDLESLSLSDRRALARLNDSKQHTEEGREELYPVVLRAVARASIVSRCVRGIDARGLHRTNLDALRSALMDVACDGAVCLVDGFKVADFGFEQRAVVDGDCRSAAIAASSVLAKVTRDRYMRRAAERHPGWEFETNVGYSTPEHRAAIAQRGISPLHRLSFQSIAYQQLAIDGGASSERVLEVLEVEEIAAAVEADADGIEAQDVAAPGAAAALD